MNEPSANTGPTVLAAPFGINGWRADPGANRLERDGEETSLEPKVMDLLALLAAAPGRTFSREELDDALWPGVTVGDDALARTISKLRRALGDSANAPSYIETIPKRGYRLIAEVTFTPDGGPAKARQLSPVAIGALAFCALALAALVVAFFPVSPENAHASPAAAMTDRADDLYMRFTRADNEAAIALYERAIAADLDYAPAQAGLANALVQRVIRWQSPPGAAPSAQSLAEALAKGLNSSGDADALIARAIDLGERAVRLAPRDADAVKALGFAYSARGDLVQAKEIYERAAELDRDAWEVMINLGELASISGDTAAALNWFEQAYEAMDRLYAEEPQRISQWRVPLGVLIGQSYEQAGDHAAAEAWYRRVLDQTPLEPEATMRLAGLLRSRGASSEADRLCEALNARIDIAADCTLAHAAP